MMSLEIVGADGKTLLQQGTIQNVDRSKVSIVIDFRKSWEAEIRVNQEIFIDLKNNIPSAEKK